jgi:hypothetical protein
VLTFDLGGVGFGLQAFLTTFSKEDIVSRDEPESDPDVRGGNKRHYDQDLSFYGTKLLMAGTVATRTTFFGVHPHSLPQNKSAENSSVTGRDRGRLLFFASVSPTFLCHN